MNNPHGRPPRSRREKLALAVASTVVLVRVLVPNRKREHDPLEELEGLARTAGARIVGG